MQEIYARQIERFLAIVDYPVTKESLIEQAREMGAVAEVCASLERLPNTEFEAPVEVSHALGGLH